MASLHVTMTRYGATGYQLGSLIADRLPKRQAEALLYTANGFTDQQAAAEMQCAPDTVKHLRAAAHYKCGSHTGPELIAKAFAQGYLRVASITLAWAIGLGALTTPIPGTASDENDLLRIRHRRQGTRRQDGGLWWDEETGAFYFCSFATGGSHEQHH